jgi:hypothetical protein
MTAAEAPNESGHSSNFAANGSSAPTRFFLFSHEKTDSGRLTRKIKFAFLT